MKNSGLVFLVDILFILVFPALLQIPSEIKFNVPLINPKLGLSTEHSSDLNAAGETYLSASCAYGTLVGEACKIYRNVQIHGQMYDQVMLVLLQVCMNRGNECNLIVPFSNTGKFDTHSFIENNFSAESEIIFLRGVSRRNPKFFEQI